jgi:hypothetical protein
MFVEIEIAIEIETLRSVNERLFLTAQPPDESLQ